MRERLRHTMTHMTALPETPQRYYQRCNIAYMNGRDEAREARRFGRVPVDAPKRKPRITRRSRPETWYKLGIWEVLHEEDW